MKSIVIFGGAGFIGKHIIRSLSKKGYKIIIPYQIPTNEAKLRLLGSPGQIIPFLFSSIKDEKLKMILKNCQICINLKTVWDQKKATFDENIFQFNSSLLSILKNNKYLEQFIFFSGLGVDENQQSLRSIAISKSEKILKESLVNSVIVRPGVIVGEDDQFLTSLLKIFKKSFFIPIFSKGISKFQPVFIEDVSQFVETIILKKIKGNHLFELGGPNIITYREFYKHISKSLGKKKLFINFPISFSKILFSILEKISLSPIKVEQLSLFERDNVVRGLDKEFKYFSIKPQDTLEIVRKISIK